MDSASITQLVFLVILLLLSAFFSSAETAFTTASRIRIRTLAEGGSNKAKRVLAITDDMHKMLSAILIGNNIVNLSASSIATTLAIKLFGSVGAGVATGILTILILIFGEISPKTVATVHADSIALAYSSLIYRLMQLLTPVIFIVNQLSMGFLKLMRFDPGSGRTAMTEEEFKTIVDVGHETGVLENSEHEMINNVFDFGDSQAKEIMIPRIDMTFVKSDSAYEELIEIFKEVKFTRFPVYEDTTDNVTGIINMKDLLLCQDKEQFQIHDWIRKPFFTYEQKNISELFLEMQKNSINIAIVLDEYGVTAGMITLEDLLEEIVGEIRDEYDADEVDSIRAISPDEYIAEGAAKLDDINDAFGLKLESDDYDSIAGHIINRLEHLPHMGESIQEENVVFTVKSISKNRIDTVHIRLLPKEEGETESEDD